MADYSKAFSPSFASKTFTTESIAGIDYTSASKFDLSNIDFTKANSLKFNPVAFDPGVDLLGSSGGGGWTFITAPEDVSWDIANAASRVDIFGTNNPPVVAGSRGMRDLTLSNSLAEGFVRGVSLEGKISALENLLNYSLNSSDGFVSVPVYQVWANSKSYGGPEAYYIIKDVKIKEAMRDIQGNTTRAYVDVSLMQVPAYQVNSGRDQANKGTLGGFGSLKSVTQQAGQQVAGSPANGGSTPGAAGTTPASGSGAGGAAKPSSTTPPKVQTAVDPTKPRELRPTPP